MCRTSIHRCLLWTGFVHHLKWWQLKTIEPTPNWLWRTNQPHSDSGTHYFTSSWSITHNVMYIHSTLTRLDEPYPMLVLCGPLGSGKSYFVRLLVEEFPSFFGLGSVIHCVWESIHTYIPTYSVSHTTRPQGPRESHGRDYYFIDDGTFTRALESVRTQWSAICIQYNIHLGGTQIMSLWLSSNYHCMCLLVYSASVMHCYIPLCVSNGRGSLSRPTWQGATGMGWLWQQWSR